MRKLIGHRWVSSLFSLPTDMWQIIERITGEKGARIDWKNLKIPLTITNENKTKYSSSYTILVICLLRSTVLLIPVPSHQVGTPGGNLLADRDQFKWRLDYMQKINTASPSA